MNFSLKKAPEPRVLFFWIVIPGILAWLGIHYIFGDLLIRPGSKHPVPTTFPTPSVVPFEIKFPEIQKKFRGLITFYFDDAWLSEATTAAPILRDAGFTGALAVSTGMVGWKNYANWSQIRDLQQEGWEIANHTVAHNCLMQNWDAERISDELMKARMMLWQNHLPSDHFVSPCGVKSPQFLEVVKREFISFRNTMPGYNDLNHLDPYDLRVQNMEHTTTLQETEGWIDEAMRRDAWLILVFHQVGEQLPPEKSAYDATTDLFTAIVNYVKTRGIQVVVPTQAFHLSKIESK